MMVDTVFDGDGGERENGCTTGSFLLQIVFIPILSSVILSESLGPSVFQIQNEPSDFPYNIITIAIQENLHKEPKCSHSKLSTYKKTL